MTLSCFAGITHLKVAAYDEQIDAIPASNLAGFGDRSVYGIEGAMALQ